MDLINLPFPAVWQWAAWLVLVPSLAWSARAAPWQRFQSSESVHVWYGTIFCLTLLWSLKATVSFAFTFHLLGVSLFALLAGPQLALLGTALVIAIVTALRDGLWANYALSMLVAGIVPLLVTSTTLRAVERWLPPNVFIYVFVVAFFGSWLGMVAVGAAASTMAVLGGAQPGSVVFREYLPYFIYLGFAEATITGMLLTMLVVYRPTWVTTFDDARYLLGR